MLTQLVIRNIVLMEHCDIALSQGLCVLTGETGAGKSILLDALGLALGTRGEARLIRPGAKQAEVTATFDVSVDSEAQKAMEALGLEISDELIIRRTLSTDGKTRCFVNDTAVSVAGLKALGESLLEIHGQHDGRGLLDPATHREILDAYGELESQAAKMADSFAKWRHAAAMLLETEQAIAAAAREKDYLLHMQKELSTLAPEPGEEESLADTRNLMMQSEKIANVLNDARTELAAGKSASGMLNTAARILSRSSHNAEGRFADAIDALEKAVDSLMTAEQAIEKLIDASRYDPVKQEQIEERLFALRGAARKYNVAVDELPALLAEVNDKLSQLQHQQQNLDTLTKAVSVAREQYLKEAGALSKGRIKAGKNLEKAVGSELASLKLASTTFKVQLEPLTEDRWSSHGVDSVQFQASTNKGSTLAPLHKIASGGELSRFMLAMKVALAKVKSTPTLIFDEIDTGTGGAVADAIGQRLAELGKTHQVLVVTHLPQVAARGNHHLLVLKEEKSGKTFTEVQALSTKTRKEELARMLAGATITTEARKAAEKLLQAAG